MERSAEEVEVTLTVIVPATKGWRFHISEAMTNVGHTIVANPEYNAGGGDGCTYTYQYSVKGV
jgi:hypothetical protein